MGCHLFRRLSGQIVSNCEKQEVDDDISTDTLKKATVSYSEKLTGMIIWGHSSFLKSLFFLK